MTLLVHRDPLHLIETKGRIEAVKKLPDFLSKTPLIAHPSYIHTERNWNFIKELFIKELAPEVNQNQVLLLNNMRDPFYYNFEHKFVHNFPVKGIPALWSGWRSCIIKDQETQQMYRLKGITFRNPPQKRLENDFATITVEGGVKERSVENERIYSNRFNKFLKEEGIEPAMEYVGKYVYPIKVYGENLAASIIKTKGDTRLDELTDIIEYSIDTLSMNISIKNEKLIEYYILEICDKVNKLYFDMGFIVGRMKKFMDKIKMTWSDNLERINHHLGNVVVYPSGENLYLGFVDFESACNRRDMSKTQLRIQQINEFISMQKHECLRGACARPFLMNSKKRVLDYYDNFSWKFEKENIVKGFARGYYSNNELTNKLEYHRLEEIVFLLNESIALATK